MEQNCSSAAKKHGALEAKSDNSLINANMPCNRLSSLPHIGTQQLRVSDRDRQEYYIVLLGLQTVWQSLYGAFSRMIPYLFFFPALRVLSKIWWHLMSAKPLSATVTIKMR